MAILTVGKGFNSATNQVKPSSVFASVVPKIRSVSKLRYYSSVYKSAEHYKQNMSNAFKVGMPIPVPNNVNLDFALSVASNAKKENNSLIYIMHIVDIGKKEEFDEVPPVLSDIKIQNEIKNSPGALKKFYEKYGDSYISSIYYGKEIAITIEFQNCNTESAKKINSLLNLGVNNVIKLENIAAVEKITKENNIQNKINIQATGFKSYQLPPVLPNSISDLTSWLSALHSKFSGFKSYDFTEALEYEITQYNAILVDADLDTTKLSMKTLQISQYFSRIQQCRTAIDEYFQYYEFLGDSEQILAKLHLYKGKLNLIEGILHVNNNLDDIKVINAVKDLRTIISELNKLNEKRKYSVVVNKITPNDFIRDTDIYRRYISKPFQINFDPKLVPKRFAIKVSNPPNKRYGTLGLYYSYNSKVPYNSYFTRVRSLPVASNIALGTSAVLVPEDLLLRGLNNLFFAYHYEDHTRSGIGHKEPVELEIETAVSYKMPEEIYISESDPDENKNMSPKYRLKRSSTA